MKGYHNLLSDERLGYVKGPFDAGETLKYDGGQWTASSAVVNKGHFIVKDGSSRVMAANTTTTWYYAQGSAAQATAGNESADVSFPSTITIRKITFGWSGLSGSLDAASTVVVGYNLNQGGVTTVGTPLANLTTAASSATISELNITVTTGTRLALVLVGVNNNATNTFSVQKGWISIEYEY